MLENEQEIVKQAKKDDEAFVALYNHYFPKVYGYIFKRTGSKEATEDIVSEVFLKVFNNIGAYKYQGYSFSAWVFKIATNKLIDYYRKNGRKVVVSLEQAPEIIKTDDSPEEMVLNQQNKAEIEKILIKLSPRYQEIINLRYFAELSLGEIAVVLKISTNNTGVLLFRALQKFREVYNGEFKNV